MGNASSKAAKSASKLSATNTTRKYPTRPPPPTSNNRNVKTERPSPGATLGPTVHPRTQTSENRDQAIKLDASDPDLDLNARARRLGPVVPNPTLSNSSIFNQAHAHGALQFRPSNSSQTIYPSSGSAGSNAPQNPAVSLLAARSRLAAEAEEEFSNIGRKGTPGRRFLDVMMVRQVLLMREKGAKNEEIEEKLGLRKGIVGKLGGKNLVSVGGVVS